VAAPLAWSRDYCSSQGWLTLERLKDRWSPRFLVDMVDIGASSQASSWSWLDYTSSTPTIPLGFGLREVLSRSSSSAFATKNTRLSDFDRDNYRNSVAEFDMDSLLALNMD